MEKDESIIGTLKDLRARFGDALMVVDHWDADLMAVGVSSPGHPDRLVYVCTFQRRPGHYYVDLESPPPSGSQLPYEQGEAFEDVDFETLAAIV